jgi:hypothetical protein
MGPSQAVRTRIGGAFAPFADDLGGHAASLGQQHKLGRVMQDSFSKFLRFQFNPRSNLFNFNVPLKLNFTIDGTKKY